VLRAILDAANECLGHFDDRPAAERWCDTLFHLLDLAAFATELGGHGLASGPPEPQCVRNTATNGHREILPIRVQARLQD